MIYYQDETIIICNMEPGDAGFVLIEKAEMR